LKILHIACLSAALSLPPLSLAELPLPNDAFGRNEAAFDFCSQVDSKEAANYQKYKKALVRGASNEEIAKARESSEYKDAYNLVIDELGKAPKEQTIKACSASLKSDN
jgi:hypothetical protein